jgi:hypothetical protein
VINEEFLSPYDKLKLISYEKLERDYGEAAKTPAKNPAEVFSLGPRENIVFGNMEKELFSSLVKGKKVAPKVAPKIEEYIKLFLMDIKHKIPKSL